MKYQFLCDENERWIYRCNRMTGEIECFSMSSNKLACFQAHVNLLFVHEIEF